MTQDVVELLGTSLYLAETMIPHVISRPDSNLVVHFTYDFNEHTTQLKSYRLHEGSLELVAERTVQELLRYPTAREGSWYTATMKERQFGEPAYIERWSWDDLERLDKKLIEHPKFGLTAMGVSPDESLLLADRFYPQEGQDPEETLVAKILDSKTMEEVGSFHINAGMSSPSFSDDNKRVAAVLYDQDRCSADVYELKDKKAQRLADLASSQIGNDFFRACIRFLPNDEVAVWSFENWSFKGQVGVYNIKSGEARFVVELPSEKELEEDEEDFSFMIENTELGMVVDGSELIVGTVGSIVTVDLTTGKATPSPVPKAGAIPQVRRVKDGIVCVDHKNELFVRMP